MAINVEELLSQLSKEEREEAAVWADRAIAALVQQVYDKYRTTPGKAVLIQCLAVGAAMGSAMAIAKVTARKANCDELQTIAVKVANEIRSLHERAEGTLEQARRSALAPKSDELVAKDVPPSKTGRRPLPRQKTQPRRGPIVRRRALVADSKPAPPRTPATPVKAGSEPSEADIAALMELFKSGGVGEA